MPKPQPKSNIIHQHILAGLLANKTTTRIELRTRRGKPAEKVPVQIATLAGNVSDLNVDRAAKRWAAA